MGARVAQIRGTVNAGLARIPPWSIYLGAVGTAAWLFWAATTGALGPDPVDALTSTSGSWTIWLLVAGLWMGPVQKRFGLRLVRLRRAVGLSAFLFAALHVATWSVFDQGLDLDSIVRSLTTKPFLIVGAITFLALIPLAITSNNRTLRAMGPHRWRRLHLLVHPILALGLAHWAIGTKVWETETLAAIVLVCIAWALRWAWPTSQTPARGVA